jgi:uncharacterized protein YhbP (UPF0306 family)
MHRKMRKFILNLMGRHNVTRIATVRRDGYPQATTIAYANDGLTLYFACDRDSQKVRNLAHSKKVSLTIDRDCADWNKIKGLSMAATARVLRKPAEIRRGLRLLARKFPAMAGMLKEDLAAIAVVMVTPKVISVIDYTKGFGHAELVRV